MNATPAMSPVPSARCGAELGDALSTQLPLPAPGSCRCAREQKHPKAVAPGGSQPRKTHGAGSPLELLIPTSHPQCRRCARHGCQHSRKAGGAPWREPGSRLGNRSRAGAKRSGTAHEFRWYQEADGARANSSPAESNLVRLSPVLNEGSFNVEQL